MSQEGPGPELTPVRWSEVRRTRPAVAALGNFDGVHLGHARILDSLVEEARATGWDPVLITFEPHPRHYFRPQEPQALLATPAEKLALLKRWPVEVIPLAFDAELAGMEAERFIREFLQGRVQGRRFLLGHDHRFGQGARGDAGMLRSLCPDPERDVRILEPLVQGGQVVSSSAIRARLDAGKVEEAAALLGRSYSYGGLVSRGDSRGRSIGYPTANLDMRPDPKSPASPGSPRSPRSHKALVARGVYGGHATWQGKAYPAVANIGVNPTFDGTIMKIEVHLLDFDQDLYGRWLEFALEFQIRPERRFDSVEALKSQIAADVAFARIRLGASAT